MIANPCRTCEKRSRKFSRQPTMADRIERRERMAGM
jgi:hypothetical protein